MTKFTPKPWEIQPYYGDGEDAWFFEHTIVGPNGEFICHTSSTAVWCGTAEFCDANAALIAAAPTMHAELLKLCNAVRNAYPAAFRVGEASPRRSADAVSDMIRLVLEAEESARATLAKAEGAEQ